MIKKTTLAKSFVASLAIAFALNNVACSHEQSKAGWDGVREGAASEQSGSADSAAAEGDKSPTTDVATSAPADTAGSTVSSNDDKKQENSENLDSGASAKVAGLMPEGSASAASPDSGAAANTNLDKKDDLTATAGMPDSSKDVTAQTTASTDAAALPPVAPTPDSSAASSADKSSTDIAAASPASVDTSKTETAQAETAPAAADNAQGETATNAAASSVAEKSADKPAPSLAAAPPNKMVSHLPKFPTKTVKVGEQVLNRYYFTRSGDNAESVATKIFGTTQASQDLVKWNGGKSDWKPGQIIKYASPQAPADQNMVSFWEERNVSPTAYQVKVGDTLSKIAQTEYGDLRSWSEIAVTNKIANPDRLAVGMSLNLFRLEVSAPVSQADHASSQVKAENQAVNQNTQAVAKPDLNAKPVAPANPQDAKAGTVLPPQAQAAQPAPQAKSSMDPVERDPIADVQNANVPSANVPAPGTVNDLPLPGQVTKTPPAPAKASGAKEASMEVAHFVGQNLFMVALGMGAIGFLFFLMLLKRRRSQMDSEF